MDLLSLRYFQTAARMEHITKAAEALHVSQPALSKTIANLEEHLQVKLFDRAGKSVKLNDYGRRFLANVDAVLQRLEDGKKELLDLSGQSAGSVNLSFHVASHLLPDLIAKFRAEHPHVQFCLRQHEPAHAEPFPYDLCLSTSTFRAPGTTGIRLLTEQIKLAVPVGSPLAARSSVRLEELEGEGFISLSPTKQLRQTTDAVCMTAGFKPRIDYECDDPSMVRNLLKAGLGVAFFPELTWGDSLGSAAVLVPIEHPAATRTIELTWSADKHFTKTVQAFRDFATQYFATLCGSSPHAQDDKE